MSDEENNTKKTLLPETAGEEPHDCNKYLAYYKSWTEYYGLQGGHCTVIQFKCRRCGNIV